MKIGNLIYKNKIKLINIVPKQINSKIAAPRFDEIGFIVANKYVKAAKIKLNNRVRFAEEKVFFAYVFDILFSTLSNCGSTPKGNSSFASRQ